MQRAARSLGRPKLLPTEDELVEIGRKDLAKALKHNGGIRKVAVMTGLSLPKSVKRAEAPLRATDRGKPFQPYPIRRLEPKLSLMIAESLVRFEISPTAKTGRGAVEEYGVWVFENAPSLVARGRFGWVRRRPGQDDLWLHRLEGEARWCGAFNNNDMRAAVTQILREAGHIPATA